MEEMLNKPRTNREWRELSLARIWDSALTLFVEQGYRATTMAQVATRAGLTKGGIYFYTTKKEALLLQILEDVRSEYIGKIKAVVQQKAGSAQDKLVALIHWQVEYARLHPREVMLLVMSSVEFHKGEDPLANAVRSAYAELHDLVESIFALGKQSGEFTDKIRTRELASFYIAAHDGMMLEWHRRARDIAGPELVRAFRESLLNGIRPRR